MAYYTLRFPDRDTAQQAAQALGFWSAPEPIYELQPTGEIETLWIYEDPEDTNFRISFPGEPTTAELAEREAAEECTLVFREAVDVPIMHDVQVGMSEGKLNVQGASTRPDGSEFGWYIAEIGQDPIVEPAVYDEDGNEITPPVTIEGYFVNVCGELPDEASAYLAPGGYGCAGGPLFAGSVAGPHRPTFPGTTPGETTTYNGLTWTWQQARWEDGTFRADDPETPGDESFEWVIQ